MDPSLTSTGWAVRDSTGRVISGTIDTGKLKGPWRLHYAATELEKLVDQYNPELVVYEDYAMGKAKGGQGRIFHIGELGGVYKRMLWWRGIDVVMVTPSSLKLFVTGKGNAGWTKGGGKLTEKQKKEPMVQALRTDFGLTIPQYDEADAAGLMLIGEIKTGNAHVPKTALTSSRLNAIDTFEVVRGKLQSISKASR